MQYVNAWAMLSESALDRHDDTRLVVKQVLESLQQTWQERKALDADFARAQKVSAQFGKNLFDLYSQASGLPRLAELPKTRLFRVQESYRSITPFQPDCGRNPRGLRSDALGMPIPA